MQCNWCLNWNDDLKWQINIWNRNKHVALAFEVQSSSHCDFVWRIFNLRFNWNGRICWRDSWHVYRIFFLWCCSQNGKFFSLDNIFLVHLHLTIFHSFLLKNMFANLFACQITFMFFWLCTYFWTYCNFHDRQFCALSIWSTISSE